jgi:transcriptional regulator with XRE-family HTH domain
MAPFEPLGQALRYLRLRLHKKQYEIADAAGITRAMLCAYERGSREPSVTTLGKILEALGADLVTLHRAMAVIRQDPSAQPGEPAPAHASPGPPWSPSQLLGSEVPLDPEEAHAIELIFAGFCRWLRFVHRQSQPLRATAAASN